MTNSHSYVEKNNIGSLFEFLMTSVLRDKPASPVQYLVSLLQERGEALLEDPIAHPVTDPISCEGHAVDIRKSFERTLPRAFPSIPIPGPTEEHIDDELHSFSSSTSPQEHEVPHCEPHLMSVKSCDVSVLSWYEGDVMSETCTCSIRAAVKAHATLQSTPHNTSWRNVESDDSGTELNEDDELADEGLQTKQTRPRSDIKTLKPFHTIFLNPITSEPAIGPEPSPRGLVVAGPDDPFTPRGGFTPLDSQRSGSSYILRDMSLAKILGGDGTDDIHSILSEGDLTGEEWAYAESVS